MKGLWVETRTDGIRVLTKPVSRRDDMGVGIMHHLEFGTLCGPDAYGQ